MAKQINPQNTSSQDTKTFTDGLNEDMSGLGLKPNEWTQARNAIPNTSRGDLESLSNEQGNIECGSAPYTVIGSIYINDGRWAIFSTDDLNSEIGLYNEELCEYTTLVNDPCLNFNKKNLIQGISKENFDCTWQLYWDDFNRNYSRTINIDNIPWIQNCTTDSQGCVTCVDTNRLDCEEIRLEQPTDRLCFKIQKGATGGELLNGSYFVVGAYTINQQRVTDYSVPSNVQPLFSHNNVNGSLDITVEDTDLDYDEFELVIVSTINQQVSARRIGIYSTRTTNITIDIIDNTLEEVNLSDITLRTNVVDSSDGIYRLGDYAVRVGPTEKFDFNYQPLANQISAKWLSIEYPADYYRKGGNRTSYMRDEVYPFFIRWIWDTGDVTPCFHIPGRAATAFDTALVANQDAQPEIDAGITPQRWRVYNTATATGNPNTVLPDGGVIVAEGEMGYWESSERYDDDRPEVWDQLCGVPIRHHKFPNNYLLNNPFADQLTNHHDQGGENIRILSVQFDNIQPPVDNNGNPVRGIVGYEIMRGSREGNKTVLAKGIINNMRGYDIPGSNNSGREGAYPNYPYNDLRPDRYLSEEPYTNDNVPINPNVRLSRPLTKYYQDLFTFHSPDTQFKDPFLSSEEFNISSQLNGETNGFFEAPEDHPKHILLRSFTFLVSAFVGIAYAITQMTGTTKRKYDGLKNFSLGQTPIGIPAPINGVTGVFPGALNGAFSTPTVGIHNGTVLANQALINTLPAAYSLTDVTTKLASSISGFPQEQTIITNPNAIYSAGYLAQQQIPGFGYIGDGVSTEREDGQNDKLLPGVSLIAAISTFPGHFITGSDSFVRLVYAWSKPRQHALQYKSHCFYNNSRTPVQNNRRFVLNESRYLDSQIQDFTDRYRLNNLFRNRSVALETARNVTNPSVIDNSRFVFSDVYQNPPSPSNIGPDFDTIDRPVNSLSSCYYGAMKQRLLNQYGQIENITIVPTDYCSSPLTQFTSEIVSGGDIYIGRYTEKNTFYFFYEWMFQQPDEYEFDYRLYTMVPYPMYYMDTYKVDTGEAVQQLWNGLQNGAAPGSGFIGSIEQLDPQSNQQDNPFFGMVQKNRFMYLFNSGVRDFFVESEINIELRDWDDNPGERHFDPYEYTDLNEIFNMAYIRNKNLYKYDFSLSIARLYNNYVSWGNVQPRYYDPTVAEQCYVYRPNRVMYSLQQQLENLRDNWRIYLANNYRDFKSRVTAVRPIGKNGAIFMFENESPIQFAAVDQLQTDGGIKITIGDGGLFSQPQQNLINTDEPYEYGSCQNRLSVVNTSSGLFWISQDQGKIFQLAGSPQEISQRDIKWWLSEFLPYSLTKDFPDFELKDNPVAGIGCQTTYDNDYQLVYFCKKDYKLRTDIADTVTYAGGNDFLVNGSLPIKLGDPAYFEDASWTLSYDPKMQTWVSYHDWHPNLTIASKNNFITIDDSTFWRHNQRCDLYCNFYGVDYPFEVEFASVTPMQVNVLRSIEYYMEAYIYDNNCYDRFHDLDFNFDEATIYNSEQCSGLLRLNLAAKNDSHARLGYPVINPTSIDIPYSKEEQKYRFNMFWDIIDDRGEFNPIAQRAMWNTEANGYIRNLNSNALNYNKQQLQRKKFRHYKNSVLLRRRVSGNRNMVVSLANIKNVNSPR